jgi:hypothetical protein
VGAKRFGVGLFGALLSAASPLLAQTPPTTPPVAEGEDEIVVTGQRPRGQVIGDATPERQLDAASVRALGAGSVSEVLAALGPDLRSSQGRGGERPIVLINGRRVGSFAEVRDIPSEAIIRVDILAEEVALRYGFPATARVVNFVLRRRFQATTVDASLGLATDGGQTNPALTVNVLRINSAGRVLIDGKLEQRGLLTEAERDIAVAPGTLDQRSARSLLARTTQTGLNGVVERGLSDTLALTLTGRVDHADRDSLTGLAPIDGTVLERSATTLEAAAGATLARTRPSWGWTLIANADRTDQRTVSALGGGVSRLGTSLRHTLALDASTQGTLLDLPAGPLSLTAALAQDWLWSDAVTATPTARTSADLSRSISRASVSLDVPLASELEGVLEPLGRLSVNGNAAVDEVSDVGTLWTLGAGLTWAPIQPLRLVVSWTREQGPPTLDQVNAPIIVTPNVRVFDFARGSSALVTLTEGGNPALEADTRRVFKASLTARPLEETDLSLSVTFTRSVTEDAIDSLGAVTAAVQTAFPDRFVRDASGALIAVDRRPVRFDRTQRSDVRWGINYSRSVRASPAYTEAMREIFRRFAPQMQQQMQQQRPPGSGGPPSTPSGPGGPPQAGAGGGPPFGGGGRGGGGFGGGRLQLSLFHTIRLTDDIRIAPGVPVIDLLDGGSSGEVAGGAFGGRPRHEVEATAGLNRHGLGARLTTTWTSATRVDGAGIGGQPLRFDDRLQINMRLFANLGARPELVGRAPWLRGARVTLGVDNLLNDRPSVTDAAGATPLNLQPALLDPLGRTVRLSLRKQFF